MSQKINKIGVVYLVLVATMYKEVQHTVITGNKYVGKCALI